VPPTERRGRRHTSTITVAVLPLDKGAQVRIAESDCEWSTTVGSGAGGQARNKTANAAIVHHVPSGIRVRAESTRSLTQYKAAALTILCARLQAAQEAAQRRTGNARRRRQIGSGERGDKVRTIRTQDGIVVDHRSGRRMNFTRYARGRLDELWPVRCGS
jgi:peptide chain release factor 1